MKVETFKEFMNEYRKVVEMYLNDYVSQLNGPKVLKDSMRYSLEAGGKRIRPVLLYATLHCFGKLPQLGTPVAAALEMIHTYSLIHDDLPAMDDDHLRRGKPTNHIVFGEATAILAGDALLTHAFSLPLRLEGVKPEVIIRILKELADASGAEGMIAGQVLDMDGEGKNLSIKELEEIHINKTGRLLVFPLVAGGLLAEIDEKELEKLREFGYLIGLAFQIQDDILDVEGTEEEIGKPVGSDVQNQKSTYTTIYSVPQAKQILNETVEKAKGILETIKGDTQYLSELSDLIVKRKS